MSGIDPVIEASDVMGRSGPVAARRHRIAAGLRRSCRARIDDQISTRVM